MFTFGNGGSCTDSTTLAGLFARPPIGKPLPAWSLTADQAIVTALGNDVGFELVFARQLIARAKAGDIAIAMSTSGNSPNLLAALAEARQRGLYTIGFAGYDGGAFANNPNVDACFIVRSQSVHRIQESQALLGYQLWLATHDRRRSRFGGRMSKPAGEYLSSGPRFAEGEVIERIESFRRRRPRLLDDHVTLAHGAGGKAVGGVGGRGVHGGVPQPAAGVAG